MKEITEDYVSFETAKLLKEKGFDNEVKSFYGYDSEFKTWELEEDDRWDTPNNWGSYYCSAPTLQMAMKWLREVHKIFIDVNYDSDEFKDSPYFSLIINMNTNDYFKGCGLPQEKSTYEEACEAAIKYCLEKLI